MSAKILRLPAVKALTGLSRSSIYEYMAKDEFPRQVKLGPRAVGWSEQSIIRWIETKAQRQEVRS